MLPHPPRDTAHLRHPFGQSASSVSARSRCSRSPTGRLLLQTLRSHDQFNTTIYGHDDRYRGLAGGRHVVMVHPDDLARLGLEPDQRRRRRVACGRDGSERVGAATTASSPYPTSRGCAAAYYPECNVLVPLDSVADGQQLPHVEVGRRAVRAAGHHQSRTTRTAASKAGSDHTHRSGVEPTHLS